LGSQADEALADLLKVILDAYRPVETT
jgi:hypothetical protein